MRKNIIFCVVIFIIIGAIIFFPKKKELEYYKSEPIMLSVEVAGAVTKPGTYQVEQGANLAYVINLAGGILPNADITDMNLSVLVESKKYEIKSYQNEINLPLIKVNLNEVTYLELITIPNITDKRALNILLYREQNKKFNSIDELKKVTGIGDATFEKIKQYFYI